MKNSNERILLVESDPETSDLIARQTLQSMGYQVRVARTAAIAIQETARFSPDIIIANINLPDLSGKDLLVALTSQGFDTPVIILAQKGMETDIIQAFRVGATDFLLMPIREAEIVSAAERALKLVRSRRERENLAKQLKHTNDELKQRVRELTTIFAIGKAVTSITSMRELFDKIIEGAVYITGADSGWFLMREDTGKLFKLVAQRNLPESILEKINQPWDDGLSTLVALSGESLTVHGEPMERFKIAQLGKSAMVVPVKLRKQVVGLLVVLRKTPLPFSPGKKNLLEAVADYSSISLVNARLFRALENRARSLQNAVLYAQSADKEKMEILSNLQDETKPQIKEAKKALDSLLSGEFSDLNAEQKGLLHSSIDNLQRIIDSLESIGDTEKT